MKGSRIAHIYNDIKNVNFIKERDINCNLVIKNYHYIILIFKYSLYRLTSISSSKMKMSFKY